MKLTLQELMRDLKIALIAAGVGILTISLPILLMMGLSSCSNRSDEPCQLANKPVKYNDRVEITKGFLEGLQGRVIGDDGEYWVSDLNCNMKYYQIEMDDKSLGVKLYREHEFTNDQSVFDKPSPTKRDPKSNKKMTNSCKSCIKSYTSCMFGSRIIDSTLENAPLSKLKERIKQLEIEDLACQANLSECSLKNQCQ